MGWRKKKSGGIEGGQSAGCFAGGSSLIEQERGQKEKKRKERL